MQSRSRHIVVLLGAALCIATNASAQTSVTVCGTDNAAGGMNLRNAVALGARITFKCGAAPAVIKVTAPLPLKTPTQIDGEGRITLQGPGAGSMFVATTQLELANIQVKNEGSGAAGIVRGSTAEVLLRAVGTTQTTSAYEVASLSAQDSSFEANGTVGGPPGVIISAERVQLTKTTFNKNLDHPVGGGQPATGRAPLSRKVRIDDSIFTENGASLLAYDASVTIRNSKFTRNGAAVLDVAGSWGCCGGALTAVNSRIEIFDSEFAGNGSAGFGGAVLAISTDLRVVSSLFQENRARVGGAIFSWGQSSKKNIWNTQPGAAAAPGLSLSSVRFHQNTAQYGGGAVAWSGAMTGNSALFAQNRSDAGGAVAHWGAIKLPAGFQEAFSELVAMTTPQPQSLSLSRGVFVENQARVEGAAILGGNATVALGNALVVRNAFSPQSGQGAAIDGNYLDVANSSIADNTAGGMRVPATGQKARVVNTLILRNAGYGCSIPAAKLVAATASVQFPASDCAGMTIRDPQLESNYKPALGGPASNAGDVAICISDPLVAALDLSSVSRGNRGGCAIGAYEPDPRLDPVSGWSAEHHPWVSGVVFWLTLLCFLLAFCLAFMWMWRRRHRKREAT